MTDSRLDRTPVVAAVAGSGTAAIIVFALMPVLVGAMAQTWDLNDLQSGLIATAYFCSYALVALSSPLWIRRWNWRYASLGGFSFMLLSLTVALTAADFMTAQLAIAAVGVGAGVLYPVSLTLASDMANTERVYAIKLAVEQLVPAALLVLMSLGWWLGVGLQNILTAVIVVVFLCLAASTAMPESGKFEQFAKTSTGVAWRELLALTALSISFAGFAGLWVFLEIIGSETGFEPAFTTLWLAVGLITSGLGPILAALVNDRLGQVLPFVVSIPPCLLIIALLAGQRTEFDYAAVLTFLPLFYYFAMSYMMSLIAAVDSSGKIAGLMSFALAVGAASGPALYGAMKEVNGPVLTAMAALIFIGTAMMIPVARQVQTEIREVRP
jgi:predicted MFS family arabinose efflux permease